MNKKYSLEDFTRKAHLVHGDKYDYSSVEYVNQKTKVRIKCNSCGNVFLQNPYSHLNGNGCAHCARNRKPQYGRRKLVCGIGVFDAPYSKTKDKQTRKAYRDWNNMLQRCYGQSNFPSKKAYKECHVCEEWHSFLKFREWFDENYIENYFLDKDVLVKGNKVYSPQTCCYIPSFINTLLLNCRSARGANAIGTYKRENRFNAHIYEYGKPKYIGQYDSERDAFNAYKKERERYIKEVAQDYFNKGLITEKVFNSLNNYTIEITD